VKPFDQRSTTRHRQHLPGIKNFQSDSYAEIGTDSLRAGLSSVVREFGSRPNDPPACPAWGWGQRGAEQCRGAIPTARAPLRRRNQ
jgi:hypothetical protein